MKNRFYYSSSGRIIDTSIDFKTLGRVKDTPRWREVAQSIVDALNRNPENRDEIIAAQNGVNLED